ncbi:uncharacterized protein LOC107037550 [Diachasma alloeum]|uniref:uncharacterized protein LOC107037550 n=1 Tax=Diachasma alloeum TaxID=454923 RepID=UPI000738406F|nr:uncharacterized protein LOC107037550 [Diachasma alloeum]
MLNLRTRQTLSGCLLWLLLVADANTSIVPPPWANPLSNPCAAQPRGWQLLYWPDDGKCYKIFQIGAPCPETMELGPSAKSGGVIAECRCPPGTAQSARDALCHPIFTRASCPRGQYFAPVPESLNAPGSISRWGYCREPDSCARRGQVFYPRDSKCYDKLTRGPCSKGQLLTLNEDNLAVCSCGSEGELGMFRWMGENPGCYEHYTRGPCSEPGEIFLPEGVCGCNRELPHYHEETQRCYPLGGAGPCPQGQHFTIPRYQTPTDAEIHGKCECKPNHVEYHDGSCYRLHTRGPCAPGDMLVNSTTCIPVPCKRGRLYFPRERTCYKIGSNGPCPRGQVVLYDYSVRPSIDGISYNGICGNTTSQRPSERPQMDENSCEKSPGMFLINKTCYKLYTQGPCGQGEWLVARRRPKIDDNTWKREDSINKVRCECRPGYTRTSEHPSDSYHPPDIETNVLSSLGECQPPAVRLAKFLNDKIKVIR